ncbi:MAG TPA: class II aldolase/adducin family protein [Polyangiaceae bacterium]|nr:class II aldolase/adducin family protein [Polyangiaceae bacterium]
MLNEAEQRQALVEHGRGMNAAGINQGKSGNLSVRLADGFLVTPSALAYEAMQPDDIVKMRWDGTYDGKRRPSTEWRLHRDIYLGRSDARAIVHAHAMFATTLACLDREIPAFHYMIAMGGGSTIPCAPYATFGTQELSDCTVAALAGRKACLMSHHGMIAFSDALPAALSLAVEVETLAAMYWRALQVGPIGVLPEEEMARVLTKFGSYGKP